MLTHRPRDPQRAVDSSDADEAAVERGSQRLHRGGIQSKLAPQQRATDFSVGTDAMWPPPFFGDGPRQRNPFANGSRGLAVIDGERTRSRRVHLDAQVDPIQQRPG
jgi:hypothetical protein